MTLFNIESIVEAEPKLVMDFAWVFVVEASTVKLLSSNFLEKLADIALDGNRNQHIELFITVPLLLGAEEPLEINIRRYERVSTLPT